MNDKKITTQQLNNEFCEFISFLKTITDDEYLLNYINDLKDSSISKSEDLDEMKDKINDILELSEDANRLTSKIVDKLSIIS